MKVYKRSLFKIIITSVQSILGGLLLGLFVYFIFKKEMYSIIAFLLVEAIAFGMIFSSDRIKFELEGNSFRYFKKNKLIKEYDLKTSKIGYKTVTGGYADTFDLYIDEDVIDCEPIGRFKFVQMYNDLVDIVGVEVKKVDVKKGDN